ncbi:transmembrane protein 100-like isoform X1 [Hippocampus zosterae]|uniref:transmembrane protein 100-like isoform X1 n=2 Tax=Hippocampus zosterae TaxID=109293 RepID=UPI00223CD84C|nr:transmembrane protein 100-like isoform X1 [Hippocampus zosterae]
MRSDAPQPVLIWTLSCHLTQLLRDWLVKMSRLFLAGTTIPPDDANTASFSYEKLSSSAQDGNGAVIAAARAPRVDEARLLSAATGGAEMSCYRCTVPFGVVALIAGVVVTAVAYTFNSHGSTISVLGLVLLGTGLGLLGASATCWRLRMRGKSDRSRRESQANLVTAQQDGGYSVVVAK